MTTAPIQVQVPAQRAGGEQQQQQTPGREPAPPKISVRGLDFYYGRTQALHQISLDVPERVVMAFIGPSGCGKSTFLRTLNRMNDTIPGARAAGEVLIDGRDVYAPGVDVVELRRRVGMVFQKSNPFPKSIFDNVAYGLRINRLTQSKSELSGRVEEAPRSAAIRGGGKGRHNASALGLFAGEKQRSEEQRGGEEGGTRWAPDD